MPNRTSAAGDAMNRNRLAQLGREAVVIAAEGRYRRGDGAAVEIGDAVRRCVGETRVIRPSDWPGIVRRGRAVPERAAAARVEVRPGHVRGIQDGEGSGEFGRVRSAVRAASGDAVGQ
jgi:hypothetical protein